MDDNFKPCYVWPNPSIPFRLYLNDLKCRIFIIENLQHNFDWLKKCSKKFRDTDHFFVILGCHYHEWLVREASVMFDALELNKDNFHILFNDARDEALFLKYSFSGAIVNQNAFLDESILMRPLGLPKTYDAVYVARLIKLKRHYLCSAVSNLALVAGDKHGAASADFVPSFAYMNERQLTPDEVCVKINESRCGLILSEVEGASFSSSEYLLCGVPVVSTFSEGGRDVWYNNYNSMVVDADPESVRWAVEFFVKNPRDPEVIRQNHINQANEYRNKFSELINKVLEACGVDYIDSYKYFKSHFHHKMRLCYKPDFDSLF